MTLTSRLSTALLLAALPATLGACGDDGNTDAGVDGPPDSCAPNMTFSGEYVAWDSGPTFMGINEAVFALRSDPSIMHVTAPNGRFEMCIPPADALVDVTPKAGTDTVPGVVIAKKEVLKFLPIQSYRSFTPARAAEYGFDSSMSQLYVHVAGGSRTIASSAAPGVQKTFDGTSWMDGNGGTDIYLGNIAGTTTKITVTGGGVIGDGTITLTPGAFTYVTLLAK